MKQKVPAEKFTTRQQELSRLDGGVEIDGSQRETLPPTPEEPLGHIVAEEHKAALEKRPLRKGEVSKSGQVVPIRTSCHT